MNQTSRTNLDALNNHLFETIEMLKNNNDPKASDCEKIDLQTAKQIAEIGKVIVEGYKVKAQVLDIMSREQNPEMVKANAKLLGFETQTK